MATERLQIILDAAWRGGSAVNSAERDLKGVEGAAAKTGLNMTKLAAGVGVATVAFGAVAMGAKAAWNVLGEGAVLARTGDRFERLAVSIGMTADALNKDLHDATYGLISDTDLMSGAVDIMSGKLASTADQVVRMATVTANLGWDMGVLAQTINNQSVLRLDNLGVAAEDVIPKFNALKASGMDVKQAFTEALLQAGEAKSELFGLAGGADDAKASMDKLLVVWSNTNAAFKESFAESLAGELHDGARGADDLNSSLVAVATEGGIQAAAIIAETIGDLQALAIMAQDIAAGNFGAAAKFDWKAMGKAVVFGGMTSFSQFVKPPPGTSPLTDAWLNSLGGGKPHSTPSTGAGLPGAGINPVGPAMGIGGSEATAEQGRMAALRREYERYAGQMGFLQTKGLETAHAMDAQTEALKGGGGGGGLVGALQESVEAMSQLSAESGDLFSRLRGAKEFNLAEELFGMGDKMGWGATDMASFGVTAGLFDQGRANELMNQSYLLQAAEQMMASGMKGEELWGAIQALQGKLAEGGGLAAELFATIDETSAEAQLLLDTSAGYGELDAFVLAVEEANPVMNIGVNFPGDTGGSTYNGEPYSGGAGSAPPPANAQPPGPGRSGANVTVNAYNERTAALVVTMLQQQARNGGSAA